MIYIISTKGAAQQRAISQALTLDKKNNWAEILQQFPEKEKIENSDQIYLDINGLTDAEIKKALLQVKKHGVFWGIIDSKGSAEDPAQFFFDGAGDYIGPVIFKKGLNKKRFLTALSWVADRNVNNTVQETKADQKAKEIKLPTGKFEGWKNIRTGTTSPFFFLFVSLTGKSNLRTLVGETSFNNLKSHLRNVMQDNLEEADALLWMETENNSLYLIPPRAANITNAIEKVLKILLNTKLICMEDFKISIPVDFTFALHYGKTAYQKPGKTGAIISESVNYIFHLGAKKAEAGRLTLSEDVPDNVLPKGFNDFFNNAGVFEGIPIRHSKKFIYKR